MLQIRKLRLRDYGLGKLTGQVCDKLGLRLRTIWSLDLGSRKATLGPVPHPLGPELNDIYSQFMMCQRWLLRAPFCSDQSPHLSLLSPQTYPSKLHLCSLYPLPRTSGMAVHKPSQLSIYWRSSPAPKGTVWQYHRAKSGWVNLESSLSP